MITSFRGPYRFLSIFAPVLHGVVLDGSVFQTVPRSWLRQRLGRPVLGVLGGSGENYLGVSAHDRASRDLNPLTVALESL